MEKIWAPWRIEYIETLSEEKSEGCIFCDKPKENKDFENKILIQGKLCFVIMNIFPYTNGHLMVIPYRHISKLSEMTPEEHLESMKLTSISCEVLAESFKAQGFNVGLNLGSAAGAGIDAHIHFHVVPRWNGDTNFMPVVGNIKVISEGLERSYHKLKSKFDELCKE
ncbi:MAG: HIT domain-containing protein [Calditrichaeota bacterium]|nr:MAG: HIT domain-containing protein [Calditrichota bacterium]